MKNIWHWVIGIVVGLTIIGFVFVGGSNRQAYRIAKGAVEQRVGISQNMIDMAVTMATQSVDKALSLAGSLPSQEAKADLIKQDIQEIGNRLKAVSQGRGDSAIQRMDRVIEQFNTTIQVVEDASKAATDPATKAILDKIDGILLTTKDQINEIILSTKN
jgi:hypothetical protein